ncbi:MAG: dihydrofolate reductase [Treponema sp.]|nr:dihydrofolate reductase [Treponema sp.]
MKPAVTDNKTSPYLSLLVAYSKNRVIGSGGKIPWNLPSERNRFKSLCSKKFILMGRKSFEEIGHGLSYCTIIIISKTLKTAPEKCLLAENIEEAIKLASSKNSSEILIAGGAEIYKQTLPRAAKIYATEIDAEFSGDSYFPELDKGWLKKEGESFTENGINYRYVTFTRS